MVKTGTNRLCLIYPYDCNRCFPEYSKEAFWLRKHRYMSFFSNVNHFIAPSNFLKDRYVQWGLSPDKISVIENGQSQRKPLPPRKLAPGETRNRFAFFGQINPFKGVYYPKALATLKKSERKRIFLKFTVPILNPKPKSLR